MPDSLILESPAHPSVSTPKPPCAKKPAREKTAKPEPGAPTKSAANVSTPLARLFREMKEAERICDETRGEGDNGPTMQAYFRSQERFIEAPVSSLADVLLKLEKMLEHEDLEATLKDEPNLVYPRIILNLLRDLRAISTHPAEPTPALAALHEAAKEAAAQVSYKQDNLEVAVLLLDHLIDNSLKDCLQRQLMFSQVASLIDTATNELGGITAHLEAAVMDTGGQVY